MARIYANWLKSQMDKVFGTASIIQEAWQGDLQETSKDFQHNHTKL